MSNDITPESITHPIQLMAAWFVMLLSLVSTLLFGASKIVTPSWIPGFLVISAVAISILVGIAVFLMLTKFRPHLQGPQEYAQWLQDERRFQGSPLEGLKVNLRPVGAASSSASAESNLKSAGTPKPTDILQHPVEVSNLPEVDKVLAALRDQGFHTAIYRSPIAEDKDEVPMGALSHHEAVWIGSNIPAAVVLLALKTVLPIWPHLKYLHLSSDTRSKMQPAFTHNQVYLGGATSTAKEFGLRPWTNQQIMMIPNDITQQALHSLVRTGYRSEQ